MAEPLRTGSDRAFLPANIRRDQKTVAAMMRIHCRGSHGLPSGALCSGCQALEAYAFARLNGCPFGAEKTTCRVCPIHCYRAAEREAMKAMMRHAGPKMIWRHPWLAIRHLWVERQGAPQEPVGRALSFQAERIRATGDAQPRAIRRPD